ncbi:MAG: sensor histidine kinase [Gemmatimonadota bacterium]
MELDDTGLPAAGPDGGGGVDAGYPGTSRVFWTAYALAWSALCVGYAVFVFFASGEIRTGLFFGLTFVLPPAVLGVGAVHLADRWDWPPEEPVGFGVRHLTAAAAYSGLWVLGTSALWGLRRVAMGGEYELGGNELLLVHLLFGFLVYGSIVTTVYFARTVRRLRRERERAARAEALRSRAQFRALQARLNPHFLFNALHSVLSLIRRAPDRAEHAVERLGDLLRYALGPDGDERRERVTLGRELEMVRTYLELEQIRLGDRLQVEVEVPEEAARVTIPPLTLQSLVENAVQHGIGEAGSGGTVRVEARVRDGERRELELRVRDDGAGARPEEVEASDGRGLVLVRRRLELLYGNDAGLDVETRPGAGFEARIRVPAAEDAAVSTGGGTPGRGPGTRGRGEG